MNTIKDGGPAFPVQDASAWQSHGMTLRDYFAAKAVQALAMHEEYPPERAASTAYEHADAVLKARRETQEALAVQAGDPFAWATFDGEGGYDLRLFEDNESYREQYVNRNGLRYLDWVIPLYTRPQQPLTDEQIAQVVAPLGFAQLSPIEVARAIERAHKIGSH